MATVTGPLLSFGASGQIAKTQVYSRWKGRPYVRRLVTPANPRTTEQVKTRSVFTWLSSTWKISPTEFQTPWTAFAKGQVLTNRNAWVKRNMTILRPLDTVEGIVLSPGAAGGLTVASDIAGGSGTITATMVAPSPLPAGWSVVSGVLAAILDQDPHTDTDYEIFTATDATPAYAPVISGLTAGDYIAGAWFVYQRSALTTDLAYGAAIGAPVTVT